MRNVLGTITLSVAIAGCATTQAASTDPQAGANAQGGGVTASLNAPGATEAAKQAALQRAMLLLRRVHFGLDTATLAEPAKKALDDAGKILREHPDVEVYVEGHADVRGTNEYNLALSDRRAQIVIEYLARLGVAASRMAPIAKGELSPLVEGDTPAAYAANRRVEFRLIKGDAEVVVETGALLDDSGKPIAL